MFRTIYNAGGEPFSCSNGIPSENSNTYSFRVAKDFGADVVSLSRPGSCNFVVSLMIDWFVNNVDDRGELQKWEDFWGKYKEPHDRIYMKRAHSWGNQIKWEDNIPEYSSIYHPCILPWSTMHITSMGIVPLCPQDYDAKMNIGDINKNTIAEVWNNQNWNKIRNLHETGNRNDIKFCQKCQLFDLDYSLENWQQKELYDG